MSSDISNSLIIGASSGIAQALIKQTLSDSSSRVFAVSRGEAPDLYKDDMARVIWFQIDYSEADIENLCAGFARNQQSFSKVFICNGVLHGDSIHPEKRLENCNENSMSQLYNSNVIVPSLWLKHLLPVLRSSDQTLLTVFSARVGSIADNKLGGWYAYRTSKAALNMFVKSASIEYARRAKNVSMILFHPGTVDTDLSRPFHSNIPKGKIFSVDFVAQQLMRILEGVNKGDPLRYYDWSGELVSW